MFPLAESCLLAVILAFGLAVAAPEPARAFYVDVLDRAQAPPQRPQISLESRAQVRFRGIARGVVKPFRQGPHARMAPQM